MGDPEADGGGGQADERRRARGTSLGSAVQELPPVKWALAVVGIAAASTLARWIGGGSLANVAASVAVMLVLGFLLVLFATLVQRRRSRGIPVDRPILFLVWSSVLLAVASGSLSFTSFFFNWPLAWAVAGSPARAPTPSNESADWSCVAQPTTAEPGETCGTGGADGSYGAQTVWRLRLFPKDKRRRSVDLLAAVDVNRDPALAVAFLHRDFGCRTVPVKEKLRYQDAIVLDADHCWITDHFEVTATVCRQADGESPDVSRVSFSVIEGEDKLHVACRQTN
jgi:hypothetical protein